MSVSTTPLMDDSVKTIKLEDVDDLSNLGVPDESDWRDDYEKDEAYLNTLKVPKLKSIATQLVGSDVKKLKKGELISVIKQNYKAKENEFNVVN